MSLFEQRLIEWIEELFVEVRLHTLKAGGCGPLTLLYCESQWNDVVWSYHLWLICLYIHTDTKIRELTHGELSALLRMPCVLSWGSIFLSPPERKRRGFAMNVREEVDGYRLDEVGNVVFLCL